MQCKKWVFKSSACFLIKTFINLSSNIELKIIYFIHLQVQTLPGNFAMFQHLRKDTIWTASFLHGLSLKRTKTHM